MEKIIAYIRAYFAGSFEQAVFKERFLRDDEALIVKDLEEQIKYFEQGRGIIKESGNKIVLGTKSSIFEIPFERASSKIGDLLCQLREKIKKVPESDKDGVLLAKGNKENADFYNLPIAEKIQRILSIYRESAPHSLYNNEYGKRIYSDIANHLYFEKKKYSFPNSDSLIIEIEEATGIPNVYQDTRKMLAILFIALLLDGERLVKKAYPNLELFPLPFLEELRCI